MKDNKTFEGAEYFDLRPYTTKEIRALYGVSWETFKKWLVPFKDDIGERIGMTYTVKQVKVIIDKLGFPSKLRL